MKRFFTLVYLICISFFVYASDGDQIGNILKNAATNANKKIEQSEDFQIYCPYHKEETEFLKELSELV